MFTLISMGFAAIPLIVSIFTGKQLAIKEKRVSDRNEVYVASVKDLLSGFSVVKSFQAENQAISLYKASNRNLEQSKKERNRTSSLISTLGAIAQNMAQFGVLLTSAWMVTNNISGLTVGMVMVFTTLMHFVIQPIATIPQLLAQRKSAVTLINKLAANLAHNVSDQGDDLILSNDTPPLIQVDQVFYSYTENKPALKDLSFDFMPGKSYAVVGGSGSGKSTLLNLLMGMDNGYRGSIQLNHQVESVNESQ